MSLDAANRTLSAALWTAVFLLAVLYAFGCTRPPLPPAASTPPRPRMFSVSPSPAFEPENDRIGESRVVVDAGGTLHAPGETVVLTIFHIGEDTPKAAATAAKLALATNAGILVQLDGMGGKVVAGLQTAQELAAVPDVRCQVKRFALSMNAFLFEAAPCVRSMYRTARLVFHRPSIERTPATTPEENARYDAAENKLTDLLCAIIEERTGGKVTSTDCEEHLATGPENQWPVTAQQALALGLVDFLVAPPGAK